MKHLFYILILILSFNGCQKAALDPRDQYVGSWNFEVIYSSIRNGQTYETIVNCQGTINKGANFNILDLQHGIHDHLHITVNQDGIARHKDNTLLGIIEDDTCLLVNHSPKESTIDKITIKGKR